MTRSRDLTTMAAGVMELHWRPDGGYTVPNGGTYPWLWLWDSCFHAIIWASLGDDERATSELAAVFAHQDGQGFVPHMAFFGPDTPAAETWGPSGASSITQPPMYGHALRVLAEGGRPIGELGEAVRRGLRYLLDRRRAPCGLIRVLHPWETGADDTPRFDFGRRPPYARARWDAVHYRLVGALEVVDGAARSSSAFDVCPAGWNALVAWNALEAGAVLGDERLVAHGRELAQTLDDLSWVEEAGTWRDVGPDGTETSRVAVLEALLPALVTESAGRAEAVLSQAVDPAGFGSAVGPAQVRPDEATYERDQYWRGPAWPQLTYLLWRAAQRQGLESHAGRLAAMLAAGADASGMAEYWDPVTGQGLGAVPQSWTALAAVPALEAARRR
jgi:hypothetical protein